MPGDRERGAARGCDHRARRRAVRRAAIAGVEGAARSCGGALGARACAADDRHRWSRRGRHDERGRGRACDIWCSRGARGCDLDGHGGADDEPIHGGGAALAGSRVAPICINSERPVSHAASGDPRAATTYDSAALANPHEPDLRTRPGQQLRYVLAESIKAPYALIVGSELVEGSSYRMPPS